jgi:hypothetical protein
VALALAIIGPRTGGNGQQGRTAQSISAVIHRNPQAGTVSQGRDGHRRTPVLKGVVDQIAEAALQTQEIDPQEEARNGHDEALIGWISGHQSPAEIIKGDRFMDVVRQILISQLTELGRDRGKLPQFLQHRIHHLAGWTLQGLLQDLSLEHQPGLGAPQIVGQPLQQAAPVGGHVIEALQQPVDP